MNKPRINLIHGHGIEPIVTVHADRNCPPDYLYIFPDKEDTDFLTMARTMLAFETERNDWIRKYDNVYQGLKYWRDKALTSQSTQTDVESI